MEAPSPEPTPRLDFGIKRCVGCRVFNGGFGELIAGCAAEVSTSQAAILCHEKCDPAWLRRFYVQERLVAPGKRWAGPEAR